MNAKTLKELRTTTLRPGLLVSLRTNLTGNVHYDRTTLVPERVTKDGRQLAEWQTKRTISDYTEHERGLKAQAKAGALIRGVCAKSNHGLLCPESKAEELNAAVKEARSIAEEFNETATLSRLSVYVVTGRVAADDVEAVKAINAEVGELLDKMKDGVKNLDVKKIRAAANEAKQLESVLTPDAAERVQVAIEAVRKTARTITKAGEAAAVEVDLAAIRRVEQARTAFLELAEVAKVEAPETNVRQLDLPTPKKESANAL